MLMGGAIGGVTPAFSREEAQEVNARTVQPSRMKPTVAFLREMNGMDLPLAA
ncbi:MAG: hypothetical protein NTZ55_00595 [Candidatus Roizmanbacteria bacterium]|nr:hypothetical protein [Candidatus Roizmanbacteria bacterium]